METTTNKDKLKRKKLNGNTTTEGSNTVKYKKKISRELAAYFKSYKNGLGDWHLLIFTAVIDEIFENEQTKKILYPGCYRHITPSLVFSHVVYVDSDSKMNSFFADDQVRGWVEDNKQYPGDAHYDFICKNFTSPDLNESLEKESFDLLISACAGFAAPTTTEYLKKGGYCLISDAHYDARLMSLDNTFTLKAVWINNKFVWDRIVLDQHFVTVKNEAVTQAMVDESVSKPKARRSFKLKQEAMFYLFIKNN